MSKREVGAKDEGGMMNDEEKAAGGGQMTEVGGQKPEDLAPEAASDVPEAASDGSEEAMAKEAPRVSIGVNPFDKVVFDNGTDRIVAGQIGTGVLLAQGPLNVPVFIPNARLRPMADGSVQVLV